jgi:beta-glucosidase
MAPWARVRVTVLARAFSIWSTEGKRWIAIPRSYTVLVGDSSRDLPLRRTITLDD